MNIVRIFKIFIKSLYFNFKIFGLKGLKMYCIVGPNIRFGSLSRNSISFDNPSFGCLRLGVGYGSFKKGYNLTGYVNLEKGARLVVKGKAFFGSGMVLNVSKGAYVELGNDFSANYSCMLSIAKGFRCGENLRLGWDVNILDSDGHSVVDLNNIRQNENKEIIIGNNVWIAAKATIMKGIQLADNNIVPYGSVILKSNQKMKCLWGGNPNRVLKENVMWNYKSEK